MDEYSDYENGLRDALRALRRWAVEHHDVTAIDKVDKLAAVWELDLDEQAR